MRPARRPVWVPLALGLIVLGGCSGGSEDRPPPDGPPEVTGVARARLDLPHVAVGSLDACARESDGTVHCWGDQMFAGEDTFVRPHPFRPAVQQRVIEIEVADFASVSVGLDGACGLTATGTVLCWDGDVRPVQVLGGHAFTQVSRGTHACGLDERGTAFCWGPGANGRLGNGSEGGQKEPTEVGGNLTFTEIAAGWYHTCALTTDGTAYCWGANAGGQLGTGDLEDRLRPEAVWGDERFRTISAGATHTCGIAMDGRGLCWGAGLAGNLPGSIFEAPLIPTPVEGWIDLSAISAGGWHTCALTREGTAACRIRRPGRRRGAYRLETDLRFSSISAGRETTCATSVVGDHHCWAMDEDFFPERRTPTVVRPAPKPRDASAFEVPGWLGEAPTVDVLADFEAGPIPEATISGAVKVELDAQDTELLGFSPDGRLLALSRVKVSGSMMLGRERLIDEVMVLDVATGTKRVLIRDVLARFIGDTGLGFSFEWMDERTLRLSFNVEEHGDNWAGTSHRVFDGVSGKLLCSAEEPLYSDRDETVESCEAPGDPQGPVETVPGEPAEETPAPIRVPPYEHFPGIEALFQNPSRTLGVDVSLREGVGLMWSGGDYGNDVAQLWFVDTAGPSLVPMLPWEEADAYEWGQAIWLDVGALLSLRSTRGAYLVTHDRRDLIPLAVLPEQAELWLEEKSPEGAFVRVVPEGWRGSTREIHPSEAEGRPLYWFDGASLVRIAEYDRLWDVLFDVEHRQVAFSYWEDGGLRIAVRELTGDLMVR